jgi:hypothetical protein
LPRFAVNLRRLLCEGRVFGIFQDRALGYFGGLSQPFQFDVSRVEGVVHP